MKRYVKEFANDLIRSLEENDLMNPIIKEEIIRRINISVKSYERGLITSREAVIMIATSTND